MIKIVSLPRNPKSKEKLTQDNKKLDQFLSLLNLKKGNQKSPKENDRKK